MKGPNVSALLRFRDLESRATLAPSEESEYLVLWAQCHRQAGVHLYRATFFAFIAATASGATLVLLISQAAS